MERFTIGSCRSGRIITSHPDLDGLDTYEDIFDAMAVLSVLAVRLRRSKKNLDQLYRLEKYVRDFEDVLKVCGKLESLTSAIGAKTSIDVITHGLRLLRPEFKD